MSLFGKKPFVWTEEAFYAANQSGTCFQQDMSMSMLLLGTKTYGFSFSLVRRGKRGIMLLFMMKPFFLEGLGQVAVRVVTFFFFDDVVDYFLVKMKPFFGKVSYKRSNSAQCVEL